MIELAHAWMLALALVLDGLVGDPGALWRFVPHPVRIIGGLIALLDRWLNREAASPRARQRLGVVAIVAMVILALAIGTALEWLFWTTPHGWIGTVIVAAIFIAGRSLHDHVAAVAAAFATTGGLVEARKAVGHIVGRDPASLDEAGTCRAAIESAAENFSDAVVAPAFWFLVLGLPGLLAYKAINTADSMIGHLTPRYRDFGRAAARLDDVVNWPASRLSGTFIALAAPLAGGSVSRAFRAMRTDARRHRSPNAGWPEAAMAGALGVALAGPRRYRGMIVDDPFLNAGGRRRATPVDIRRALRVYVGASAVLLAIVVVIAVAVVIWTPQRW